MRLKAALITVLFIGAALIAGQTSSGTTPALSKQGLSPAVPGAGPVLKNMGGATPLYFIANEGQMNAEALYYSRTPGYTLWLTRDGLVFDRVVNADKGVLTRSFSKMTFIGANKDIAVVASEPTDYKVSYFIGRDESEWKTGISTSRAVVYKNLYDGIDLKVYGTEKQVEYDWIVAPGADPARIRFSFSGGEKSALDADGNLAIETPAGRIVQRKPVSHKVIDGRRTDVESAFRALPDGSFGFALGSFDPRYALTIDPLVLVYSTYLGGHDLETMIRVAMDTGGALYLAGFTLSGDFPPESSSTPRMDYFVTKLSADGASLIYSAFFPVARLPKELPLDMFVDAKGFVYLAGVTGSSSFPLKNAFQAQLKGYWDGFVLKMSRDGQSLLYSSYIGGGNMDWCTSLAVDGTGAAYLGGYTQSRDFPRKRAYQPALGGRSDCFVAKVSPQGTGLVYSTYLGGTHDDRVNALALDADGAVVLAGQTSSPNFPRKFAFQQNLGGRNDGFVAKLNSAGSGLVFSSFFGGASDDIVYALALDGSGGAYLTGHTLGKIPVKNAFQSARKGIYDAFVLKVEPDGRSIAYASYLGGAGTDSGFGIAADGSGAAYVVGSTQSADFPIKSPYQPSRRGSQDAFLTVVDPAGGKLTISTFLGGFYRETGWDIFLGASGEILIGGVTNSLDLPKAGTPFQDALDGDYDAFILKFTQSGTGRRR
jgi:hypothetical protein